MRIRRESSLLLLVDLQARLAPAISGHERVTRRSVALLDAARLLDVPVLASEHCPGNIGTTIEPIAQRLRPGELVGKTHFSCTDEPGLAERLTAARRAQVIVCGMEAHVCVMQTALGLAAMGLEVYVAADACGSRRDEDRDAAYARMAADGLRIATTEMAMFEWMGRADVPPFRELLKVVKGL